MDELLLDTDILSEVLKRRDPRVLAAAGEYLVQHGRLSFSAMTLYEIVRGLRAYHATKQLGEFLNTAQTSDVFPISVSVLLRAADLWAEGRAAGHPHGDADLIIAATALEARRTLVTGNTSHYSWISGLQLTDWRTPLS